MVTVEPSTWPVNRAGTDGPTVMGYACSMYEPLTSKSPFTLSCGRIDASPKVQPTWRWNAVSSTINPVVSPPHVPAGSRPSDGICDVDDVEHASPAQTATATIETGSACRRIDTSVGSLTGPAEHSSSRPCAKS